MLELRHPALLRKEAFERPLPFLDGETVLDALVAIADRGPRARDYLLTADGRLRRSYAVLVNGVDIRSHDGPGTRLNDGDILTVVPSLSGG